MNALLLTIAMTLGQLQAPLDDAICAYRAQSYQSSNTVIPNEGTLGSSAALTLGPTAAAETQDPQFFDHATDGKYLRYTPANDSHATAAVAVSQLNGAFSCSTRLRLGTAWTDRLLPPAIVDPGPVKHFMLHATSGNKVMARFWEHPNVGWAQIGATSTTTFNTTAFYRLTVTWDVATKENKLYVDGVLEATGTTGKQRSDALTSALLAPYPFTTLKPSYDLSDLEIWHRTLSASEVQAIPAAVAAWVGSAPPPEPGQLRVFVNGTEQPMGTTVKIDGVSVPPPSGSEDKIVEVESP